MFGGDEVPPNWLFCNGQTVSRVTYFHLFNVIGTLYGVGDHIRTFNVPDFRGRFPLGLDTQLNQRSGIQQGGATHVTLTQAELPPHSHSAGSLTALDAGNHTHPYDDPGHNHGGHTGSSNLGSGGRYGFQSGGSFDHWLAHSHTIQTDRTYITILNAGVHGHLIDGTTAIEGNGQPFSIMPPYQIINYIIYAGPEFNPPIVGK